jgi:uncharacterized membrane protein
MLDKLDTLYVAMIGFIITFISVAGKIISTDLYPEKSIKAKLFIIFSKAILGFILVFIVVKGLPILYPTLSSVAIYVAWLVAYLAVDIVPIVLSYFQKKAEINND